MSYVLLLLWSIHVSKRLNPQWGTFLNKLSYTVGLSVHIDLQYRREGERKSTRLCTRPCTCATKQQERSHRWRLQTGSEMARVGGQQFPPSTAVGLDGGGQDRRGRDGEAWWHGRPLTKCGSAVCGGEGHGRKDAVVEPFNSFIAGSDSSSLAVSDGEKRAKRGHCVLI